MIHGGRVLLNFGPGKEQFIVAVSLNDGEVLCGTTVGGNNDRQAAC